MNSPKVTMESHGATECTNGNDVNPQVAAFFDVDGTLVNSTIVHYYVRFRLLLLHPLIRPFWLAGFLLKIPYYLLLDRVGTPVVVNPGKTLRQIATESGWTICEWSSRVN